MGYIDIHSHILPAVDDGSQSMEESMEMLAIAAENGITEMILTPHNKAERRNVSVVGIQKRLKALQTELDKRGLPITLYSGTEIFYRNGVVELLEDGVVSTMAGSKYVLVEFQPMEDFSYIRAAVYELVSDGYIPILAHIERYECLVSKQERIKELIDRGALMQVNAATIVGKLGHKAKQQAKKLLKQRLVHFVATDAHDTGKRGPYLEECARYLNKKYGEEYTAQLLWENAWRMIKGTN